MLRNNEISISFSKPFKIIVKFFKMKVMKPYFAHIQYVFIAKVEATYYTTAIQSAIK